MVDLRDALRYRDSMGDSWDEEQHGIGIVRESFSGAAVQYGAGEVVVFRRYFNDDWDDYSVDERRPTGKGTVEMLTSEEQKRLGVQSATIGTIVNVPLDYIEEVLV